MRLCGNLIKTLQCAAEGSRGYVTLSDQAISLWTTQQQSLQFSSQCNLCKKVRQCKLSKTHGSCVTGISQILLHPSFHPASTVFICLFVCFFILLQKHTAKVLIWHFVSVINQHMSYRFYLWSYLDVFQLFLSYL